MIMMDVNKESALKHFLKVLVEMLIMLMKSANIFLIWLLLIFIEFYLDFKQSNCS